MNPTKRKEKRIKKQKTYFALESTVGLPNIINANAIYTNKEDALNAATGGDFVYEIKVVKTYKAVDESMKLVEIK